MWILGQQQPAVLLQVSLGEPPVLWEPLSAQPVDACTPAVVLGAKWDGLRVRSPPGAPYARPGVVDLRGGAGVAHAPADGAAQVGQVGQEPLLVLGHFCV